MQAMFSDVLAALAHVPELDSDRGGHRQPVAGELRAATASACSTTTEEAASRRRR